MNRNEWMEQVLREVRFAPDRRKIRQELLEHMEDRMEEYLDAMGAYDHADSRPDFDELLEKAEVRLMNSMGDPAELGRELNQQHKPWLGWLWMASRILLTVSVCLVVGMAVFLSITTPDTKRANSNLDTKYTQMAKYYDPDYNHSGDIYYCLEPDYTVELLDTEITFRLFAYDDSDGRLELLVTSRGTAELKNAAAEILCNGERSTMLQSENGQDRQGNYVELCKITYERFDRDAETLHITYDKFGEHFEFTVDIASGVVIAGEVAP